MSDLPNIDGLLARSEELRTGVPFVLTFTSDELVKREITKRKRFRVELRIAKGDFAKVISELQNLKRQIEAADEYQATDIGELDDKKWELIRGEKDSRSGHATDPEVTTSLS